MARKDYKDFERRLDNALVRLDELNINYHIPQPEQPNGSCDFVAFTDKASLEFKTTRPVKVVYTIGRNRTDSGINRLFRSDRIHGIRRSEDPFRIAFRQDE